MGRPAQVPPIRSPDRGNTGSQEVVRQGLLSPSRASRADSQGIVVSKEDGRFFDASYGSQHVARAIQISLDVLLELRGLDNDGKPGPGTPSYSSTWSKVMLGLPSTCSPRSPRC